MGVGTHFCAAASCASCVMDISVGATGVPYYDNKHSSFIHQTSIHVIQRGCVDVSSARMSLSNPKHYLGGRPRASAVLCRRQESRA